MCTDTIKIMQKRIIKDMQTQLIHLAVCLVLENILRWLIASGQYIPIVLQIVELNTEFGLESKSEEEKNLELC